MIGVIDYGAGNLRSVEAALARLGVEMRRVTDAVDLNSVDGLVLPGVGRFAPAAVRLREAGLWEPLKAWGRSGRPLLGICLGMQLLFDGSDEDPGVEGLGLIPGVVARLNAPLVPHIGWAPVAVRDPTAPAWRRVPSRFHAYYAHSFAVPPGHPAATADTACPVPFTAAVGSGAVRGLQFHPEKSGQDGATLLNGLIRDMGRPPASEQAVGHNRAADVARGAALGQSAPTDRGRPHRVIPCLDIKGGRVVKGVRFRDLRDAGDPVERARAYDDDGADEVCLLDVSASQEERRPLYDLVSRVAAELRVPFSVGGGIRSVDEMRRLLLAGADRVSLGTAAVESPDLVREAAQRFGRQFVIVSIDARRRGDRVEVMTHGGTRPTGLDAVDFARDVVSLGTGEILLNAMEADGTRSGYDLALTRAIAQAVSVPVIASGGAGTPDDLARALLEGQADAVLAASIFHDGDITIREAKMALRTAGLEVRL
jgi:cyclase